MSPAVFFFLFPPLRDWERKGAQAVESDEDAFREAMARPFKPLKATGAVAKNYPSACPFHRGHWLDGGKSWVECEIGGHVFGVAWYRFCGPWECSAGPEECPLYRKYKEEHKGEKVQSPGEGHREQIDGPVPA